MNKKPILKDFPELPTGDVFNWITTTADLYGIEHEPKIDKIMNKKTIQMKEIEDFKAVSEVSNAHDTDFRTVTKFLWFPKTIEGTTKWLVFASWQEQFIEVIDDEAMELGALNCFNWVWKPVKWL